MCHVNLKSFCLQQPSMYFGRLKDFAYNLKQFCDTNPATYNGLDMKSGEFRAAIMVSPKTLAWKYRTVCSIMVKKSD